MSHMSQVSQMFPKDILNNFCFNVDLKIQANESFESLELGYSNESGDFKA